MSKAKKITLKQKEADLKEMLSTNIVWATSALLKVLANQTKDEVISECTDHHNGIGFTGTDAKILTSFAKQLQYGRTLSSKQSAILLKKMPKYWRQIMSICDKEKLEIQVFNSLVIKELKKS
jgi:hypothetical protein